MNSLFSMGVTIAVALSALLFPGVVAAQAVSTGPPISVGQLSAAAQTQIIRLLADPLNASVVARTLDISAFKGDAVTIILGDAEVQLTKQFSTVGFDGIRSWAGKGQGFNSGVFAIENGRLSGTVQTASGTFSIDPLDGDVYAFIALNMSLLQRRDD